MTAKQEQLFEHPAGLWFMVARTLDQLPGQIAVWHLNAVANGSPAGVDKKLNEFLDKLEECVQLADGISDGFQPTRRRRRRAAVTSDGPSAA